MLFRSFTKWAHIIGTVVVGLVAVKVATIAFGAVSAVVTFVRGFAVALIALRAAAKAAAVGQVILQAVVPVVGWAAAAVSVATATAAIIAFNLAVSAVEDVENPVGDSAKQMKQLVTAADGSAKSIKKLSDSKGSLRSFATSMDGASKSATGMATSLKNLAAPKTLLAGSAASISAINAARRTALIDASATPSAHELAATAQTSQSTVADADGAYFFQRKMSPFETRVESRIPKGAEPREAAIALADSLKTEFRMQRRALERIEQNTRNIDDKTSPEVNL